MRDSSYIALLKVIGREVVRTRYGVRMVANWHDFTFRLSFLGYYGKTLQGILDSQDRPFVFIDIGANQGLFSLLAARNEKCSSVISFEPVPCTFDLLQKNIKANEFSAKIQAVNSAISHNTGKSLISYSSDHSGVSSMRGGDQCSERIEISTMNANALNLILPRADRIIVKIDVEGHEEVVAEELSKLSHWENIVAVFYEIDEKWTSPKEMERLLSKIGMSEYVRYGALSSHYDILATSRAFFGGKS